MTAVDISPEAVNEWTDIHWLSPAMSENVLALSSALQQAKSQVSADQYWMSEAAKLGAMVERLTDEVATAGETNSQLSSALTQSRAETVAAYERAAQWHVTQALNAMNRLHHGSKSSEYTKAGDLHDLHSASATTIRALATPDQTAALAAVVSAAEVRGREAGMREAAEVIKDHATARSDNSDVASWLSYSILAAIPHKGETK